MLGDDAPEGAGVGCTDGLSFIDDGSAAMEQGGVNNVGMAHNPANVGGGPEDFAGLDVVDVLHGPFEGDRMAAVVTQDALGLPGGAGGVEDVEGIGGGHGNARNGFGTIGEVVPVEVPPRDEVCFDLRPLKDNALFGLVGGKVDGFVHQGLVGQNFLAFDAAGGGDDNFGFGVVDTDSEFVGGKAAKDDGMDGADAGAGQHRCQCFGNHGHIDDDGVALYDTDPGQCAGKDGNALQKLTVGNLPDGIGDGAVVDDGHLVFPAVCHVVVQCVVTGVQLSACKPTVKGLVAFIKNPVPLLRPLNGLGRFPPEGFRPGNRMRKNFLIVLHRYV